MKWKELNKTFMMISHWKKSLVSMVYIKSPCGPDHTTWYVPCCVHTMRAWSHHMECTWLCTHHGGLITPQGMYLAVYTPCGPDHTTWNVPGCVHTMRAWSHHKECTWLYTHHACLITPHDMYLAVYTPCGPNHTTWNVPGCVHTMRPDHTL